MSEATSLLDTDQLPEYGAAVTSGGQPAGTLTTPTARLRFGRIGFPMLESRLARECAKLEVAEAGGTVHATVLGLPTYDSEKKRPRS